MLYYYSKADSKNHQLKEKLPDLFHKAMNFNNEIFVYWGSFNDCVVKDFYHHTAIIAINSKGKVISAIGLGQEGHAKLFKIVQKLCQAQSENNIDELYYLREEFIEAIENSSIQKIY